MRALKAVIVLSVWALASAIAFREFVVPYRTNLLKKRVEAEFDSLIAASSSGPSVVAHARDDIARLKAALLSSPSDIDLYMEMGAEYRVQQRWHEAAQAYEAALVYARRPEIYRNLGDVSLLQGDISRAVESYAYAVAFAPEQAGYIDNAFLPPVQKRADEIIAAAGQSRSGD